MYQNIGIKATPNYSPNFNLIKRLKKKIKFIIIHYTGMKTESAAIKKLQDSKSKVSSHFYIKKNGNILVLVLGEIITSLTTMTPVNLVCM